MLSWEPSPLRASIDAYIDAIDGTQDVDESSALVESLSPHECWAVLRIHSTLVAKHLDPLITSALHAYPDVNAHDPISGMTLLHFAVRAGADAFQHASTAEKCVRMLLEQGADPARPCTHVGLTPVHLAAMFGASCPLKALLESTSARDAAGRGVPSHMWDGATALHLAVESDSIETVRTLVETVPLSVSATNTKGHTAAQSLPFSTLDPSNPIAVLVQASTNTKKRPPPKTSQPKAKKSLQLQVDTASAHATSTPPRTVTKIVSPRSGRRRSSVDVEGATGGSSRRSSSVSTSGVTTTLRSPRRSTLTSGIPRRVASPSSSTRSASPSTTGTSTVPSSMTGCSPRLSTPVDTHGSRIPRRSMSPEKRTRTPTNPTTTNSSEQCNANDDCEQPAPHVGESVVVRRTGEVGVVRYVGALPDAPGQWLGVHLPSPVGKNNGVLKGKRYFSCPPKHGIFVRDDAVSPVKKK